MAQNNLSQWDGSNLGYHINITNNKVTDVIVLSLEYKLLLTSTFFLILFILTVTMYVATDSEESVANMGYVLHSTGTVAFIFNLVEIICTLKTITEYKDYDSVVRLRVAISFFCFIVACISAVRGLILADKLPNVTSILCPKKITYSFIFFNVSFFSLSLLISTCPLLLLSFSYPIEVMSLVLFLGFILICAVLIVHLLLTQTPLTIDMIVAIIIAVFFGIVSYYQTFPYLNINLAELKLFSYISDSVVPLLFFIVFFTIIALVLLSINTTCLFSLMYIFAFLACMSLILIHINIAANSYYTDSSTLLQTFISIFSSIILWDLAKGFITKKLPQDLNSIFFHHNQNGHQPPDNTREAESVNEIQPHVTSNGEQGPRQKSNQSNGSELLRRRIH